MTGAGFAIPLLGAAGAQAADLDTWDRVAQCESGGLWSADTGNGYYGGLQLTQEIWERYDGTAYAERPDLASRSQQIAVAEKILADRGPEAWPSCGVNAGLRHDTTGEAPAIDPDNLLPEEDARDGGSGEGGGLLDGILPGGDAEEEGSPAGGGDGSGSGGGAKDGAAKDGAAKDGTQDESRAPEGDGAEDGEAGDEARAGAEEGTGKHRGERDPRELELERGAEGRAPEGREAAGDERSGETADRSARAERPALAGTVSGPGVSGSDEGYLVRPGDSLVTIAQEQDVPGGWSGLYESNKDVVGEDPDLILPGQELSLG
ncbi:transglycosylase family protein [Streptomyces barkulensis]|uniref:transglycosylase family protein n=1 Tax=Streptomyces barkulensis TaxID=1257026 RepID=UPI0023F9AA45|nr:transglycosylase family protein [Streptomyces barkulensis]